MNAHFWISLLSAKIEFLVMYLVATPLYMASSWGHENVVKYLLAKSASVEKVHKSNGFTCLHAAAAGGHLGIVMRLLEAGSDKDAKSSLGKLPEDVIGLGSSKPLTVVERGVIQEAFRKFRYAKGSKMLPSPKVIPSPYLRNM